MSWVISENKKIQDRENLKSVLLKNRAIANANEFFDPNNPIDISLGAIGISSNVSDQATEIVFNAIDNQKNILVYGDYDADGICATAIVKEGLASLGVSVDTFIPDRQRHGYGVTIPALEEIFAEKKPDLIITVDNGIVAHDAISFAETRGVNVVLTDHHLPLQEDEQVVFPAASVVFHSTQLCGTTVAWMFVRELLKKRVSTHRVSEIMEGLLDLCAIATIADLVTLTESNRSFAVYGLQQLRKNLRLGLQVLFEVSEVEVASINSGTVGYRIAPMINAMGRISSGDKALALLLSNDHSQATKLAHLLVETNRERQDITISLFSLAKQQAILQSEENVTIVSSKDFHEGVIGLIAGKLVEEFAKPAIVLSASEAEMKASVRSIPGVHIVEFLEIIRSKTLSLGGHPMAGGFSIETKQFDEIREILFMHGRSSIKADLLQKNYTADCVLPINLVSKETLSDLKQFEPFGKGNGQPTFVLENLEVSQIQKIGKAGQHLRLVVSHPKLLENNLTVLCWNQVEKQKNIKKGEKIDMLGKLDENHWRGKTYLQFVAEDVKLHHT